MQRNFYLDKSLMKFKFHSDVINKTEDEQRGYKQGNLLVNHNKSVYSDTFLQRKHQFAF